MERFGGKVAIVTGGAGGIGHACAARLLSEGARVMLADLSPPGLSADNAAFVQTDMTRADEVSELVAETVRRWGHLDILVNNAGIGLLGDTPGTAEDDWDRVFAINTRAIYLACKAAIPEMAKGGGGAIVNVCSISGMFGDYSMAAYNASKGAAINYTRSLALDCAGDGIRVNALCPGLVDTPMSGPPLADPVDRAHWFERIPLGRAARPEEVAAVICFLASDDASYMTGAIVAADGGVTAHTGQPDFPKRIALRKARSGA